MKVFVGAKREQHAMPLPRRKTVLNHLKLSLTALIMLAGAGAASAARSEAIQNKSGTFIQDRSGAWHQYYRARRALPQVPDFASERIEGPFDHAKGDLLGRTVLPYTLQEHRAFDRAKGSIW